jgi:hypothetical protein
MSPVCSLVGWTVRCKVCGAVNTVRKAELDASIQKYCGNCGLPIVIKEDATE